MKTIRQWVGGEYYEGSPLGVIPVENPATGEVTAELLQASKEDLDHTVEAVSYTHLTLPTIYSV